MSSGYSFENKMSTRTEKTKTENNIQLCENIMNKYNNYKKRNDNIIIKARNITLVGAGVGVGDKSRHHRPVGRLKTCSICVHMNISP